MLDRALQPLDLSPGPRVVWLGEPVLDVVRLADHVDGHLARPGGVTVARLISELDANIDQNCIDAIGHRFQQLLEQLPRRGPVSRVGQLGDGELPGAVDADEQFELTLGSLYLSDIHVGEADR